MPIIVLIGFLWLCVLQEPSNVPAISATICLLEFSTFAPLHSDSMTTGGCLHPSFSNTSPINIWLAFYFTQRWERLWQHGDSGLNHLSWIPNADLNSPSCRFLTRIADAKEEGNDQRLNDTLHSSSAAAAELSDSTLPGSHQIICWAN